MYVGSIDVSEMCAAEALVPEPRSSEFEIAIDNLKRYKSPGRLFINYPSRRRH